MCTVIKTNTGSIIFIPLIIYIINYIQLNEFITLIYYFFYSGEKTDMIMYQVPPLSKIKMSTYDE